MTSYEEGQIVPGLQFQDYRQVDIVVFNEPILYLISVSEGVLLVNKQSCRDAESYLHDILSRKPELRTGYPHDQSFIDKLRNSTGALIVAHADDGSTDCLVVPNLSTKQLLGKMNPLAAYLFYPNHFIDNRLGETSESVLEVITFNVDTYTQFKSDNERLSAMVEGNLELLPFGGELSFLTSSGYRSPLADIDAFEKLIRELSTFSREQLDLIYESMAQIRETVLYRHDREMVIFNGKKYFSPTISDSNEPEVNVPSTRNLEGTLRYISLKRSVYHAKTSERDATYHTSLSAYVVYIANRLAMDPEMSIEDFKEIVLGAKDKTIKTMMGIYGYKFDENKGEWIEPDDDRDWTRIDAQDILHREDPTLFSVSRDLADDVNGTKPFSGFDIWNRN